jgi:glycosyltransferase involved in cell wall biosynthesis
MKILTIAIPTYNRAKDLNSCLNSIFSQTNVNYDDIEFVVSDNNSSDDTETVVREYIKKGFNINYIKNKKNIGPDNNFIQCFNLANGKYFWLIGDDDIVVDGALERILKVLKTNEEYGIVFLNSYPFLNDFKNEKPISNKDGFIIYGSIYSFLSKVSYFLTFISTTIVNKRLALKDIDIESMRDTI